ncbi:uncharacterized protein BDR25DRAFT_352525 [Lindgomyces ingoldianus]|uniref:Uncharacterized protein n=1 Tax=Lindgomyces ingoldianus TaxID=673940 RepID=A0ACB6R187_9PLEO|nr:uncharacterized protein BDR25DRAFT_352525 [Lindgomyces ingoldianus]KAF2473049.1 hypothetical protein BDR25DRAFT_352525 [Lindgomyces ingoldianus]
MIGLLLNTITAVVDIFKPNPGGFANLVLLAEPVFPALIVQVDVSSFTLSMCNPKTVHKHVCGHYVLDRPENGCAKSTRSRHSPLNYDFDVRAPCEALMYEPLASGDFRNECYFEGKRIRIQVYFSPVFCYAEDQKWKKEEAKEKKAAAPRLGLNEDGPSSSGVSNDTLAKPREVEKKPECYNVWEWCTGNILWAILFPAVDLCLRGTASVRTAGLEELFNIITDHAKPVLLRVASSRTNSIPERAVGELMGFQICQLSPGNKRLRGITSLVTMECQVLQIAAIKSVAPQLFAKRINGAIHLEVKPTCLVFRYDAANIEQIEPLPVLKLPRNYLPSILTYATVAPMGIGLKWVNCGCLIVMAKLDLKVLIEGPMLEAGCAWALDVPRLDVETPRITNVKEPDWDKHSLTPKLIECHVESTLKQRMMHEPGSLPLASQNTVGKTNLTFQLAASPLPTGPSTSHYTSTSTIK